MKLTNRSVATGIAALFAAGSLGVLVGHVVPTGGAVPLATETEGATTAAAAPVANPWAPFSFDGAYEVEHYNSLRGTVRSATVALLGTVTDVAPGPATEDSDGRETLRYRSVLVEVAVAQVLSGAVADGTDTVRVEFGPYAEEDLARYRNLVGQRSVFLLRLKGSGMAEQQVAPDDETLARNVYRLVNSTGLLDESDGVVEVPLADRNEIVDDLAGDSFDATVARVDRAG